MALTKVKANNITLTTAAANSNDTTPATTQYVTTAINNLIDGAPATLNTLDEIAAALNDDAALNTTLTNAIAAKLPLAGGTMTGDLMMGSNQIIFNNNSQAIQIKDAAGTASYVLYQDNADTLVLGNGTNVEKIRLDTGGNEGALVIDTNGNVGIGGTPHSSGRLLVSNGGTNQIVLKGASGSTNINMGNFVGGGYISNNYYYSGGHQADDNSKGAFEVFLGDAQYTISYHSAGAMGIRRQDFHITDTGNVGIGTNNPIAPLHVDGNAVIETGSPDLYFATTSASHTNWRVAAQEAVTQAFEIASGTTSAGSNAVNDTYTPRFVINSSGNVGIGTNAPFGATSNRTCLSVNGTSSVSLNIGVGNAQKGYLYTDGNFAQFGSVGAIPLKFAPNDSPKMELFPSGELSMYGNKMVIDSDYSHWSGRYQHLTCHNAITSSNAWTDVAYVSYSPSLTIQGMAQRDNDGGYGASNYLGTVFGGYGAVSATAERSVAQAMNGGGFGALEYRYLNSGASSGSYRLQVRISITSGTMYVTTTLTGHAFAEITED